MRYKIKLISPQIYVVDTVLDRYWPVQYPINKGYMWPGMNPEAPDFKGTILEKIDDPSK